MQLRTQPGSVTLADLVRSTLRLRPDRIIIGEVRGAEALDLLKAWNTGHPGGITTLHANSAHGALARLEQLTLEATPRAPFDLIAEAIDVVVFMSRAGGQRRVLGLLRQRFAHVGHAVGAAVVLTIGHGDRVDGPLHRGQICEDQHAVEDAIQIGAD